MRWWLLASFEVVLSLMMLEEWVSLSSDFGITKVCVVGVPPTHSLGQHEGSYIFSALFRPRPCI
jgi:hypothetical protein